MPNFIIVGAPKAGTTSLCRYLAEHPLVFMSNPKEVNYFSYEEMEDQGLYYKGFRVKNFSDYQKLFDGVVDEKSIGEGSVSYLFYPNTPLKIKKCIPDVKIIIMLRNPVDRGFSHYLMDKRLGLVDLPYSSIVRKDTSHINSHLYYQQYIEFGLYYKQVKRYIEVFGLQAVKILLLDDLNDDADKVVRDVCGFLGVYPSHDFNLSQKHNVYSAARNKFIYNIYRSHLIRSLASKYLPARLKQATIDAFFERKARPVLDPEVKNLLIDMYSEEMNLLQKLIGRDLSGWYKKC